MSFRTIRVSLYGKPHSATAKLISVAIILLCCLPLLFEPGAVEGQSTAARLDHVTLQLRWKHQFQFAGYYAAQQQDFYLNAGLDVNIVEAQDGQDPIGTVVDGQAEFGVGNSELVLWRSQGKPVVVLGVIFQHSPLVLLTTKDSGIDTLHALIGKRVAIEENSAELLAYLQDEGISTKDMQMVSHPFDPQALIAGTVDAMSAYSTDEPFLLQNAGLDYQVFSPRSAGIDFYGDVLFTTEDEIKQHPQRVQAFLDASMQGWKYAFEHEDELIDYIYTHLTQRHSREHLKFEAEQMRKLVLPDLIEPGYMYAGRWTAIVDTYARVGLIPASFPVSDMLYEKDVGPDLRPLYIEIAVILAVTAVVGLVALRIYRLNKQLRRENLEREKAQAELIEGEERYRSLVETAPFPVVITRLSDNTIRYLNPRAEVMLQAPSADAVGRPAVDYYVYPEDRHRFMEVVRDAGEVHDFEVCLRNSHNHEFWVAMSAIGMIYEGHRSIFVAFKDITERRWMEDRLRESEALYRSILNASPDAVAITDLSGNIQLVSPAGLRLFGYTSVDEVIGQPLSNWVVPEERPLAAGLRQGLLDGKNTGTAQYRVTRKDGGEFEVEVNGELIRDANNQPHQMVSIIRDVTERKRAEAQAFALAVEQQRVKVLSSFIQNASHEFRTPLSIINSSIYLLSRGLDEKKRQQHAEKAEKQIKQITRLIEMLTAMAELDSGAPLRLKPLNLNMLVDQIVVGRETEFSARQLSLRLDATAGSTIVQGDVHQLDTALSQLLENAQRYTAPGGKINLKLYTHDDNAVIDIRDTGAGISADALPHIFERFWREDEAHTTPGFGLGLPLAQKIVMMHGGTIEVESKLGSGSLFRVILPLVKPEPSELAAPTTA